jgi:hypothetical protein
LTVRHHNMHSSCPRPRVVGGQINEPVEKFGTGARGFQCCDFLNCGIHIVHVLCSD